MAATDLRGRVVPTRGDDRLRFGGFEFRNPLRNRFEQREGDVAFTDVDGDNVVVRKAAGDKVDLFVNEEQRLARATIVSNGGMLEVTGSVKQGFAFLGALGFELEDIVTEGVTPSNPVDLQKAMALVQ